MNQVTTIQIVAVVLSIIGGSLSIVGTVLFVGWKLRGYFSDLQLKMTEDKGEMKAELAGFKEVMIAVHRRVERLEVKVP